MARSANTIIILILLPDTHQSSSYQRIVSEKHVSELLAESRKSATNILRTVWQSPADSHSHRILIQALSKRLSVCERKKGRRRDTSDDLSLVKQKDNTATQNRQQRGNNHDFDFE
jgi:hypothetical protein